MLVILLAIARFFFCEFSWPSYLSGYTERPLSRSYSARLVVSFKNYGSLNETTIFKCRGVGYGRR